MEEIIKTSAYIWFDAEYTDLDLDKARLLQVAAIATDSQLNRLLPPERDIKVLVKLEEGTVVSQWVQEHLADVVERCRSDAATPVARLDIMLKVWLAEALAAAGQDGKNRPVLAGNSIHADWFLVRKFLPLFTKCLHYRVMDVTTLKLLWQDWRSGAKFDKENAALVRQYFPGAIADLEGRPHDAYYDAQASIAELNFYRSRMLEK